MQFLKSNSQAMKKVLLQVSFCLIITGANSQIAFHDAKDIRKNYVDAKPKDTGFNFKTDDLSISTLATYLKSYLSPEILKNFQDINETQIFTLYKNNPFIGAQVSLLIGGSSTKTAGVLSKSLNSLGSLNVTNLADGIAQFLIKRGKEELNAAFFNRMKRFLDEHIECKTLFPSTTGFFQKIESYRFAEFIQSLREAFHEDLSNMLMGLNQLIDLPKYQDILKNQPEVRVVIRSSKIVSELSQADEGIYPDSLIHKLSLLNEWNQIHPNLANSWKLLDEISQSVREKFENEAAIPDSQKIKNARQRRWIKLSDFHDNLLRDPITLKIYLGLLYQKVEGLVFTFDKKDTTVQAFMKDNQNNLFVISNLVENFVLLANDVDRTIKDITDKLQESTLSNNDYYTYIKKAINITEYGFKVANTIKPGIANDRYITMARNANELYESIYTKNYNNAIMNIYQILEEIFDSTNLNESRTIAKILKYGNFMASVVRAESPAEVQNAIEAAALPVGSSSIKKNTVFNISLNGYLGYYTGKNPDNKINGWNPNNGITAPVGVAFNKGLGQLKNTNIGSISAYFTLINVGAIVGYRLNNDSTAIEQKILLENIFSPAGYLVYGFPGHFPISIGYGTQRGPRLYKVENGNIALAEKSRWRSNWFLAVDIPFVNFWTINKFKKNNR